MRKGAAKVSELIPRFFPDVGKSNKPVVKQEQVNEERDCNSSPKSTNSKVTIAFCLPNSLLHSILSLLLLIPN